MGERGRAATAAIAMAAVLMAGCAEAPYRPVHVPRGGIAVGHERLRGGRHWWPTYWKDGYRIDLEALPEAMADNDAAVALLRASNRENDIASGALLTALALGALAPTAAETAFRHEGRTWHETVPLTMAGIGVVAFVVGCVVGTRSSHRFDRALRLYNESKPLPPPEPPAEPPFDIRPVCPIGADC
jgi:hypothetical protein